MLLAAMGDTDKAWFEPVCTAAAEGEAAIIIATAHSKSVTAAVKSYQRHQDDVKLVGFQGLSPSTIRFEYFESVVGPYRFLAKCGKPEFCGGYFVKFW